MAAFGWVTTHLRLFGLAFGVFVGLTFLTIGLVGTWREARAPLQGDTTEIAPGAVSDGRVTIRITGVTHRR